MISNVNLNHYNFINLKGFYYIYITYLPINYKFQDLIMY